MLNSLSVPLLTRDRLFCRWQLCQIFLSMSVNGHSSSMQIHTLDSGGGQRCSSAGTVGFWGNLPGYTSTLLNASFSCFSFLSAGYQCLIHQDEITGHRGSRMGRRHWKIQVRGTKSGGNRLIGKMLQAQKQKGIQRKNGGNNGEEWINQRDELGLLIGLVTTLVTANQCL